MNALKYVSDFFIENPTILVAMILTCIEITPIRINPLRAIFSWMGSMLNRELNEKIQKIDDDLNSLKSDFELKKVDDMRWEILIFANECHCGKKHSRDAWRHTIATMAHYEKYTDEKGIVNGVVEEESEYLKGLYHSNADIYL